MRGCIPVLSGANLSAFMPRPAPVDIEIQLQSGVTVAALEFAPAQGCNGGEAERCLALHGWLDSAATFELLVPHLPDDMRIVAIDFTGHGKSSHGPPGTSYSFVDYAVEVLQVANELGWRRFSILGHSMGGVLGGLVAAAHPDRVERLVVIDVLGPVPTQPHRVVHALHRSLAPDAARPPRVFNSLEEAARRKQHGVVEKLPLDAARVLAKRQLKQVRHAAPRCARTCLLTAAFRCCCCCCCCTNTGCCLFAILAATVGRGRLHVDIRPTRCAPAAVHVI